MKVFNVTMDIKGSVEYRINAESEAEAIAKAKQYFKEDTIFRMRGNIGCNFSKESAQFIKGLEGD